MIWHAFINKLYIFRIKQLYIHIGKLIENFVYKNLQNHHTNINKHYGFSGYVMKHLTTYIHCIEIKKNALVGNTKNYNLTSYKLNCFVFQY